MGGWKSPQFFLVEMQNNLFQDQKFRGILYQTLVVGFFALGLYFVINTTAYNLEKRNIATGFGFLNNPAGFDISFSPFLGKRPNSFTTSPPIVS